MTIALISKVRSRMPPNTRWSAHALDVALGVAPQVDRGEQVVGGPARARSWRSPASTWPARPSGRRWRPAAPGAPVGGALQRQGAVGAHDQRARARRFSVFRRRARAPASGRRAARRGRRRRRRRPPAAAVARSQRSSAAAVRGRALATSGFSTARCSSAPIGTRSVTAGTAAAARSARTRAACAAARARASRRAQRGGDARGAGRPAGSRWSAGAMLTARPRRRSASSAPRPGRPRT